MLKNLFALSLSDKITHGFILFLNNMTFSLDTRLAESSIWIADLPLSELRLKNHKHYPWCLLIPRLTDVRELYELSSEQQIQLMQEIKEVSLVMQKLFKPMKLNVGSLGNVVSQLHIHVVVRQESDPLWPQGIWQKSLLEVPHAQEELDLMVAALQQEFVRAE
jgi:diadenosine tetraphosphate (Ap4A) HIT family hydrolase